MDVVFGRLQNSVPEVEELRRKREEDSLKCRRMLGAAGNTGDQNNWTTIRTTTPEDKSIGKDVAGNSLFTVGEHLANTETNPLSTDMEKSRVRGRSPVRRRHETSVMDVSQQEYTENMLPQQLSVEFTDNDIPRGAVLKKMPKQMPVEAFQSSTNTAQDLGWATRSPSAGIYYNEHTSRRATEGRTVSPTRRHGSHGHHSHYSKSISPANMQPQRHRSRSPVHMTRKHELTTFRDYKEIDRGLPLHDGRHAGSAKELSENYNDRQNRRRRDSTTIESRHGYRRSLSPMWGLESRRVTGSTLKSTSPVDCSPRRSHSVDIRNDRAVGIVKTERASLPSLAYDRRTRRYKQAVLESRDNKTTRRRKKAILHHRQGEPYGPGIAAWVAEVNKLASALDPSCNHIRKQTYEDMCIVKSRLNERFDYSAELNEDHLRALLGKAVTRKRTELLGLIRRGADQPMHIDVEIWKRLEKLASSEQRALKKKHGQYANACSMQMLGRTGSIGVQGIRQRMREVYGQSPDPPEVRAELERDKGFGKQVHGIRSIGRSHGKGLGDECLEEELLRPLSNNIHSEEQSNDDDDYVNPKSLSASPTQWEKVPSVGHVDRDVFVSASVKKYGKAVSIEKRKQSTEEYIAELEAELETLRGGIAKGTSSSRLESSALAMGATTNNDACMADLEAGISTRRRSTSTKARRRV